MGSSTYSFNASCAITGAANSMQPKATAPFTIFLLIELITHTLLENFNNMA